MTRITAEKRGSISKRPTYTKPRRGHWTVAEAARAWGLSTGWVRQLIARGRIVARLMTDAPSAYWAIDVDQPHPGQRKRVAAEEGA